MVGLDERERLNFLDIKNRFKVAHGSRKRERNDEKQIAGRRADENGIAVENGHMSDNDQEDMTSGAANDSFPLPGMEGHTNGVNGLDENDIDHRTRDQQMRERMRAERDGLVADNNNDDNQLNEGNTVVLIT